MPMAGPAATVEDLMEAIDSLLAVNYPVEFLHVVGPTGPSVWAALQAQAEEFESQYRYLHVLAEARGPTEAESADEWARPCSSRPNPSPEPGSRSARGGRTSSTWATGATSTRPPSTRPACPASACSSRRLATSTVKVKIRIQPVPTMRWIEVEMGFENPFRGGGEA